ncbi:MAG TPA: class II aldolase/adducin family protein [Steroidobacteraceae bacterium]|nr:class II aldolase/adducin family protein [Steroidobacteraceae bacterium]
MTTRHATLRKEIVTVACELDAAGMMPNKSGNLSCRAPGGFVITPSAVAYRELEPSLLVELHDDGTVGAGDLRPSSEWLMHAAIYGQRPDVAAIVHTHSPSATALSCAGVGIPAFHYMIALAGGEVRCMPYATFGSAELAANAVLGLEGRRAVLLANHGVVAVGPSLAAAKAVALEVENMASQYLALRAAGMEPVVLDDEELQKVIEKFTDYGRLTRD